MFTQMGGGQSLVGFIADSCMDRRRVQTRTPPRLSGSLVHAESFLGLPEKKEEFFFDPWAMDSPRTPFFFLHSRITVPSLSR